MVHGRTATGPGNNRRGPEAVGAGQDEVGDGTDMPGFGQGLIAAAACFILKQADAPPEAAAAMAGPAVAGQIPVDPVSLLSVVFFMLGGPMRTGASSWW